MKTLSAFTLTMSKKYLSLLFFLFFLFPVLVHAAPPNWTGYTGSPHAFQGQEYQGRFVVIDPDGDALTFSVHPNVPNLIITDPATGRFRWTPTEAQANSVTGPQGFFYIYIRVSDGTGTWSIRERVRLWRVIESTHFKIFWKSSVSHLAYAEEVKKALETGSPNSWSVETGGDQLNYPKPKCLGGSKMPVYIDNIADAGSTSPSHAPHYVNEGNEGSPCRPCIIQIDIGLRPLLLRATCAHEFFHSIQDYYNWSALWWDEATAVWMEDKVFDDANDYVDYFSSVNSIFNRPWRFIRSTYNYGGCLFPIFISEYSGNDEIIKKSWEKLKGEPSNDFVPVLNNNDVLGPQNLRRYWREFAIRNFIVKGLSGHEYSEGELFRRRARISKRFRENQNLHYITKTIPLTYPPPRNKGMKPDHNQFTKVEKGIPGLSSYYIKYEIPKQLKEKRTKSSRFFLYFKGDAGAVWTCDVLKLKRDGSYDPSTLRVIDHEAGEREKTVDFKIGGNEADSIHQFIVIISNADISNTLRRFYLGGVAVPGFQKAYEILVPAGQERDEEKGTTKTVKNIILGEDGNNRGPDEDNIYKNGDKIKLEVDLSDIVHIGAFGNNPVPPDKRSLSADFSRIDSEYREGNEVVKEKDGGKHIYSIEYTIKEQNTLFENMRSEEDVPVSIKVTSLSEMDGEKDKEEDKTFLLTIDNEPPEVKKIRLTQEQEGKEVVILDSEEEIKHPADIAGRDKKKLVLSLQFKEKMQTHEKGGKETDPEVWVEGKGEKKLKFKKTEGWKRTEKDNDTWEGELEYSREDIKPEPECKLFIKAKDRAGNELDIDLGRDGIQPEDRYALPWKGPEIVRVLVSQGKDAIYDSEEQVYREGKAGTYHFQITFSEDMEKIAFSFGPESPYEKAKIKVKSGWGDKQVWEGEFAVSKEDFPKWQGAHRMKISGKGEFGHLDSDYQREGIQPDTNHIFLIGAPKAWIATVTYNENRVQQYFSDKSSSEGRYKFTTQFKVKLKEDWAGGRYCSAYWMESRDTKLNNRKKFIEQNLKIIKEYPESIENTKKGLKELKKSLRNPLQRNRKMMKQSIEEYKKSIKKQEKALELSKKLLSITERIHFYSPTNVEVGCQGNVSRKSVSRDSRGKESTTTIDLRLVGDQYSVKEAKEGVPHSSYIKYDVEKYRKEGIGPHVYKRGNFARPAFTLMLSTVEKKEWDELISMIKEIDSDRSNILPIHWIDAVCWSRDYLEDDKTKDWWHVHTFPEKQEGYSATLRVGLNPIHAMARKNGVWQGVRRFSDSKPQDMNFKIASSGAIFTNVYDMPVYPLFDYHPSYIAEVNSTPRFGHFRIHPHYDGMSKSSRSYHWGGIMTDHYYWMQSKKNGINFDGSFRLRGLHNEKKDKRETRRDTVLDIDVLINPLPEGDL